MDRYWWRNRNTKTIKNCGLALFLKVRCRLTNSLNWCIIHWVKREISTALNNFFDIRECCEQQGYCIFYCILMTSYILLLFTLFKISLITFSEYRNTRVPVEWKCKLSRWFLFFSTFESRTCWQSASSLGILFSNVTYKSKICLGIGLP